MQFLFLKFHTQWRDNQVMEARSRTRVKVVKQMLLVSTVCCGSSHVCCFLPDTPLSVTDFFYNNVSFSILFCIFIVISNSKQCLKHQVVRVNSGISFAKSARVSVLVHVLKSTSTRT